MRLLISLLAVILLSAANNAKAENKFDYREQLLGEPQTLSLVLEGINRQTGEVVVSGVDTQRPQIPFSFEWGDGTVSNGWFPQKHTYPDKKKNYLIKVTSHYPQPTIGQAKILVRFISPEISPIPISEEIKVSIPGSKIKLISRMPGYGISGDLTYFDDTYFNILPRNTVEYVLSVASLIQHDFVNSNLVKLKQGFRQVLLRDADFPGMYSLWYTNPVAFCVSDYGFKETIQYSSFFHEMAHNDTLNTPAQYCYGGNLDGSASAILTESLAQIFQHATAYEMANNYNDYGLSEDIAMEIMLNAFSTIKITRGAYENYINSGMRFCAWNDPQTKNDETLDTFMTIAYKFCIHAENQGRGYRVPLKRLMLFLQMLNEDLRKRYNPGSNPPEANMFRATFLVTALSYAFSEDLRGEFRKLNFPIDDEIYRELYTRITK
ncbi:MAG: hypothetical protein V2A64_03560 [Candidatus Omnitrophota bacterium]